MTEKIISSSSLREYVNVEYMGDFVYIGNEEGMDRLWIFTINDGLVRNEIHLNDNTLGNLIELFSKRK